MAGRQLKASKRRLRGSRHRHGGAVTWKHRPDVFHGNLEHFTPDELEDWMAMVKRAMRPDGVPSHVMDHRDHRCHADKTISPHLQYTLSDEEFRQVMGNSLDYHNRWLRSDWVRFFESHGYEVETRTVIPNTPDLVQTARDSLAPAFQDAPDSDLQSLVTHFVVHRR